MGIAPSFWCVPRTRYGPRLQAWHGAVHWLGDWVAQRVRCGRGERVRVSLLPLLASALSGVSAIFEKLSVVNLSGLTVLTLRYTLMLPVLWVALYASGRHRELAGMELRTFGYILLPAAMALGSLLLYFTALRGDWVSRVYPLTELRRRLRLFWPSPSWENRRRRSGCWVSCSSSSAWCWCAKR